MPRAVATIRRLRTLELNRLKRIADLASRAVHETQSDDDRRDLRSHYEMAQAYFEKISSFDLELMEHPSLSAEEIDAEAINYDENRALGLKCIAELKTCLHVEISVVSRASSGSESSQSTQPIREPERSEDSNSLDPLPSCNGGNTNSVDITPEPFDGNRLHYRSFMAQFNNWIARKKKLTPIDKLIVLRKHLRGEAKTLIESLEITSTNFDVAMNLLQQAFGQVNIERQQIMSTLFNLPRVRSSSDLPGLRSVLSIIQSCMQRMEAIGAPLSEYALALEPWLHKAIPSHLVFDYFESVSKTLPATTVASTTSTSGDSSGSSGCATPALSAAASDKLSIRAADDITGLVGYLRRFTNHREKTAMILQTHRGSDERESRTDVTSGASNRRRTPPPRRQRSTIAAVTRTQNQPRTCFFCKEPNHKPSLCKKGIDIARRREILEKLKRCIHCFRFRHDDSTRCQGPKENCEKCNSKDHYSCMHPPNPKPTVAAVAALGMSEEEAPMVLLHTASAYVLDGQRRIPVRLFLDGGSSATFVHPNLLKLMSACEPISSARMGFTTFSDEQELLLKQFRITLQSVHDSARVDIKAYCYDFKANPAPQCSDRDRCIIENFGSDHKLADVALAQRVDGPPVSLLIGQDQFFKMAHVGKEKTLEGDLVARSSILGWIVGGATERPSKFRPELVRANIHCCVASVTRTARDLERLWRLEEIGIKQDDASPLSADERSAVDQFRDGLHYDGSRYTVHVPRMPGIESLRNNLRPALDRLRHKLRSLKTQPEVYARYHKEVMAFVDQEHAEQIEEFSLDSANSTITPGQPCYFMPHHNVITNVDSGEKWRIVFDCSSAARGCRSLNSFLLAGPNLNPDIVKVLLNFRLHPVAVSADIARAYLCIKIAERDRPLYQFLWQGPDSDRVRCYRMRKVTWGSTPSGFLLASTLREHFKRVDPDDAMRLGDSFYHDDFLRSFPTLEDARHFTDTMRDHLRSAGMELAKWKTNSRELAGHLTAKGVPEAALNLEAGKLLKILGIAWRPAEDTFHFDLQHVVDQARSLKVKTKRNILSIVASIYDPLGWLAPFLIRGKLLLRELWAADLSWNDEINTHLASTADQWSQEIPALAAVRIPRCIGSRGTSCTERHLHIFGDASVLAFAAVAYLQTFFTDKSSETSIVMAKTRIAPRQSVSLPRLELMAAVLGVRLHDYIVRQLAVPVSRVWFYTDSMVAYHWCTSESAGRWKVFVANRVAEVQGSSRVSQWFHVPGPQNISDIATRGVSAVELRDCQEWWSGPAWLSLPEAERPISQPSRKTVPDLGPAQAEVRNVITAAIVRGPADMPAININRFSTLGKAVRVTEYVLSAIRHMRKRPSLDANAARGEAMTLLVRTTQREFFAKEMEAAAADDLPSRTSRLNGFKLFLDDEGRLRVRSRLQESTILTPDEKNPIVIPGESHLASLLIVDDHRRSAHLGVSTILASLRRRYWITRCRQRIKSILARCVACRKQHGAHLKVVEAPLPASRLEPVIPFRTSGLDFCGPFLTRQRDSTEKCYIAVFACSTIRAVHLELVPLMTTAQTHLAIRRFLSLYPECSALVSDNARSLVKAASDIKHLFNSAKSPSVKALLSDRGMRWEFICPKAAWRAGFYERLVGSVKSSLKKTLGKSLLSFEELRTVVAEVAAAINSRPLTYSSADPDEITPITPFNFLRGAPQRPPLCTVIALDELTRPALRADLINRTTYYKSLVSRWRQEYITQLRSANKVARGGTPTVRVGDVCLLEDGSQPRSRWELVRITEAHEGRDGNIRTYSVRFANGYVTRRAAQHLCPLEVV